MKEHAMYVEDNPNGDPKAASRSEVHDNFLGKLSPALISKVSRLVQLHRAAYAESRAISDQSDAVRNNIRQLEQEVHHIRRSHRRSGAEDLKIVEGRIEVLKQRFASLQEQIQVPAKRAGETRQVVENVLKEIEQRVGGGGYCQALFEAMDWR